MDPFSSCYNNVPSFASVQKELTQSRGKMFVSYHHSNRDRLYRNYFENLFANIHDVMVSKSVPLGEIAPNLVTEGIRQKIRDECL